MARQGNLDELVSSIVNHPNFRQSLNAAFESISTTLPTTPATARPACPGRPSTNNNGDANEELAAIFRVGGSSSQAQNPHRFERGVNHQRHRPGPYNRRPPSTTTARSRRPTSNGRSNARQKFVVKEVVLIPQPEESNVLRASRRASLMSSGYVINDVELDRTWSEEVLMEHLTGLFSSKFSDDNTPRR